MRILKGYEKNRERVLITGASGFVGGHLARYLVQKGYEVWGVYHRRQWEYDFPIRRLEADLTHSSDVLSVVKESRPKHIFHLAGQAVPHLAWERPEATRRINVEAALFLFEAVARSSAGARIVVASSSHVYGAAFNEYRKVSETVRPRPATPYGCGKLLMELAALNFVERHGLDIRIVRAFNQVGTGLNSSFVFPEFCRQVVLMERGRQPFVMKVGDICVVRDFVHIRDAVRAYHAVLKRGKRGGIYNLGSGRGTRLEKAVEFLRKKSGIPFRVEREPRRFRKSDFPWIVSDPSRLERLGWRPRESVWTALEEILEEYRSKAL